MQLERPIERMSPMTTLLYVDDEETIGRAVERWFSRRGHTVHVARSLAEARGLLGTHDPDVLFIDVWLGRESGFELMSWIEESRPALVERVVFVTGELADATLADRAFRTLGRPVLQKPFEFRQLEACAAAVEAQRPGPGKRTTPGGGAGTRSGE